MRTIKLIRRPENALDRGPKYSVEMDGDRIGLVRREGTGFTAHEPGEMNVFGIGVWFRTRQLAVTWLKRRYTTRQRQAA